MRERKVWMGAVWSFGGKHRRLTQFAEFYASRKRKGGCVGEDVSRGILPKG